MSVQTMWVREDGFVISLEKQFLDAAVIHRFLSKESYWNKGIARELVEAMIQNSAVCYGIYEGNPSGGGAKLVGFARVVSDLVKFAWLSDVFVLPDYRGRGLSKWLMRVMMEHPYLQGVKFMLATDDAQGLYAQFGFQPIDKPEETMVRPKDWQKICAAYGVTMEEL